MNSKEVIINTLQLKKTARPAVALLSGGAWTFNQKGLTLEQALLEGAENAAEIIAETNEIVKSDIVWPGSGYHNLVIRAIGGKIKFRKKGTPDVQETLFDEATDVDKIDLSQIKNDSDINMLCETASILEKNIGHKTLVGSSQWGPFTLAGHVYGVERLMRSIYRDKEAVRRVLDFTSDLCYEYLNMFVEAGAEIVSIADPSASGDLISRQQFEEFNIPYLKKTVQRLKQKGIYVLIHICGNTTNRLDLIPETGADIISVDYKVDLLRAKELLGGKIALAGNMNPVGVMQTLKPEEVTQKCIECLEKAGDGSGYVLMPGCDIPPAVPLKNIRAMVDTAYNYNNGKYGGGIL